MILSKKSIVIYIQFYLYRDADFFKFNFDVDFDVVVGMMVRYSTI
jgi:hypothetical protein